MLPLLSSLYSTERERAINEAISEAKLSAQLKDEAAKVKAASNKDKAFTSMDFLTRAFKKPSKLALKQGKARLLLEDMVKRAERKLEELKRSQAKSMSTEEKAEQLAEELYHKPGTLLTKDEMAKILIDSECRDSIVVPRRACRRANINRFRTINGVCNNRLNPTQGAAGTEFRRLIQSQYEDGISVPLGRYQAQSLPEEEEEGEKELRQSDKTGPFLPPKPSARFISKTIVRDRIEDELPFTHILMQWGQFLDHDLDLGPELEEECEGCEFTEVCEPIFVPKDDQTFGVDTRQNGECLPFRRSIVACPTDTPGSFAPREQINDLTSYIDGSMIYGSSVETADAVREFKKGLLRVKTVIGEDFLPVDTEGLVACPNRMDCFLCGDIRCNEQVSLTTMHTLWVREHNRIAKALASLNPFWSDERLYQETRKIVGAFVQKITYIDYLPKILGPSFDQLIGDFRRYDRTVDASVPNSFATAAYRYGHSLIRPFFERLDTEYKDIALGPLPLVEAFFNPSVLQESGGIGPILRGLVAVNSRRVDEFLNKVLTTQLFKTNISAGMDLASLNIQRSRDHGLPGFKTWQNFCQRIFNITSDAENQLTFLRFIQLYGNMQNVELWVGGLAEDRLPGSLLGATFACIFGLTFRNVRDGDRFYYERPVVFTRPQRRQIQRTTLSSVICDNTKTETIQPDAFLSNQTRISCQNIPSIDLSPWEEGRTCFLRVNAPSSVVVFLSERIGNRPAVFTTTTAYPDHPECIPFDCTRSTRVNVFPSAFNTPGCQRFRATIGPGNLSGGSPASGIYNSLETCRAATIAAVSYSRICGSTASPGVQSESTTTMSPESPDNNSTLPDDPDFDVVTESEDDDAPATNTEVKVQDTYADDNKLRAELAKELEKLN